MSKVGDTLTATVTGMAAAEWEWSLNGTVQAITETFEVPASAKSGDRITVTVTAEDGETASDTVYVGGFTILLVEPTTAGTAANGYKYLRAEFSSALTDLQPEDIEIRAKKDKQLYSVDTVKLSSDGKSADITLFGSVLEGGTTFLKAGTIYTMTITKDGSSDTYEFELPDNQADLLVTAVDVENGIITTASTWSATRDEAGTKDGDYKIGDLYNGNLGDLVGRTVNLGLNSDREVVDFSVNDAEVVYAAVQAKDGNDDTHFGESKKDYFVAADKTKYHLSTDETSSVTATYTITGVGDWISTDWYDTTSSTWKTGAVTTDTKWDYAKLVLNPTGTVSCAVLENWEGLIVATSAEDGVATETKNNTKDFSDFTILEGGIYVNADDITDGDVIYYNDTDKLAEIYNASVTGELEKVYTSSAVVDGTEYKWDGLGEAYATTARYYDDDNDKYVTVDEKWLLAADTDEDVTFTLDRNNNAVLIDTVQGETVTTTHDYIITAAPVAYLNGVDQMMNIGVSDGTATTLKIALSDLKYVEGSEKTTWTAKKLDGTAVNAKTEADGFYLEDKDGNKVGTTVAGLTLVYPVDTLLTVTSNEDGDVIGIDAKAVTTTMKDDADVQLKPGMTQLATASGKVALSADTNVYIITGKETDNSDMKVTKVAYSDYTQTTKAGSTALTGGEDVYTKVLVYADKTNATDIVIDASANVGGTKQNEIFSTTEVAETVVGVVKSAKTGLNSDQDKTVLKEINVMNADYPSGHAYTDFAAEIASAGLTTKNTFVSIDLDEDGAVLAVSAVTATAGDPAGTDVGKYMSGARLASTSTELVRVGTRSVRPTSSAFVAFYDGNGWTTTTIGAINRETTKYGTIDYYVSEIEGTDVSAEIIIAKGAAAPAALAIGGVTGTTMTLGTSTTGATATATLSFVDQGGAAIAIDDLTIGTLTITDATVDDGTNVWTLSNASITDGVLTVTSTYSAGSGTSADSAEITFQATVAGGTAQTVTLAIDNGGVVTAMLP